MIKLSIVLRQRITNQYEIDKNFKKFNQTFVFLFPLGMNETILMMMKESASIKENCWVLMNFMEIVIF